ncbi:hypothetical protein P4S72_02760 [Vibrio sp. PP-XX7]
MDGLFHIADAKVRILAGLSKQVLNRLLVQEEITEEEYHMATNIESDEIIYTDLPYSQIYL